MDSLSSSSVPLQKRHRSHRSFLSYFRTAASLFLLTFNFAHPEFHPCPEGVDLVRISVFVESVRDCRLSSGDPIAGDIIPIEAWTAVEPEELWTMPTWLSVYNLASSPPRTEVRTCDELTFHTHIHRSRIYFSNMPMTRLGLDRVFCPWR